MMDFGHGAKHVFILYIVKQRSYPTEKVKNIPAKGRGDESFSYI